MRVPHSGRANRLALQLLFVIDAPDSLKAYKDTTVTMMRAAQARGHAIWVSEQEDLFLLKGEVSARAKCAPRAGKQFGPVSLLFRRGFLVTLRLQFEELRHDEYVPEFSWSERRP